MAAGCTIGVDLGGTKLLAGVLSPSGEVLLRVRRPVGGLDREALLMTIEAAVTEAVAAAGTDITAAGFGVPSLLDHRTGHSIRSNHLPLDDFPIAEHLRAWLGLPVVVDNDGNCAALGETGPGGAAAGARDAVVLTLGTGIGGGLVLGGRMYRGAHGAGAELGHMVVDADGPPCFGDCPGRGCLEAFASGSALQRDARAQGIDSGPEVTRRAEAGDPVAVELLETLGRRLGAGLAGLAMIFDPEIIVVGGGVMNAGERVLGPARRELRRRAMAPMRDVAVVAAGLGEEAGMIGAALMASQEAV